MNNYYCLQITTERSGCESKLTKKQINKLYSRIFQKLYQRMENSGGTCFGIDSRTMKICYPRQARVMYRLQKQYEKLDVQVS